MKLAFAAMLLVGTSLSSCYGADCCWDDYREARRMRAEMRRETAEIRRETYRARRRRSGIDG